MEKNFFPSTEKRVAQHTNPKVNQQIRKTTLERLSVSQDHCEDMLDRKIDGLVSEWDTERVLETKAASLVLLGSLLGCLTKKSCWFVLTGSIGYFLLFHALQGWCPSLPVIRRLGIRTAEEIQNEITAVKLLRGDFQNKPKDTEELLRVAEKR